MNGGWSEFIEVRQLNYDTDLQTLAIDVICLDDKYVAVVVAINEIQ